ncbi:DinB family protein [Sphingobacterium sp. MYb382]|uniref:DinB family protein n=1 Tax=Sphingobacterium sp. MYb382 TaxID=2745278 RepID=UPI0030B26FB0
MSIKHSLLIELERETKNTARILERLSDEHLTWKPHVKSMSVKALANHIVNLHRWVQHVLAKPVFDLHVDFRPEIATSVEGLLTNLEASYVANKQLIEASTEEIWLEHWTMSAGEHEIVTLPKVGAMRYIVTNHLIHHRGQLTVYLRLLDIPVPGLYGPSADDSMLA